MNKMRDLFSKTLVVGIIFLIIAMSVVSSIDNIVKDNHTNYKLMKSNYEYKAVLSSGKIAYGYIAYSPIYPEGTCYFPLDDPGTITFLAPGQSTYFLTGGTWACDDRWFGIEYMTGILWEIDPDTGDMWSIGGGGSSCSGLSYNPVNKKLYSVCGSAIYEINITTGEQYLICYLSGEPDYLIRIAFDKNGILYGWDNSNLWIIDIENCEATLVSPFDFYISDVHFDWDTNKLYLTTYTSTGLLYEYDIDSGELTIVGNFEGGSEITCLAIPYTFNQPPVTNISFDPQEPDGENGWYVSDVTVRLEAYDDNGVNATYYRINKGVWEIYDSSFVLSEDGDDILIEYYSVGNDGDVESIKSATVDIDKTEPLISLYYELTGGNWWRGWEYTFKAEAIDDMSGMERVEFYINGILQETVYGPGPLYCWVLQSSYYYDNPLKVRGLILKPEITEEYISFYAIIVRISKFILFNNYYAVFYAYAYDNAGNYNCYEIHHPCTLTNITPGLNLFENLTLPNNYRGFIGNNFIFATFNIK